MLRNPPLLQIGDKQGGFLIKWSDPKNDHKKSAKNMIFVFRTFKVQKKSSEKQGGFLIKGGS